MKKILFVAMPESIHTCRWLNQLADTDWELHLFPVYSVAVRPDIKRVIFHDYVPEDKGRFYNRAVALAELIEELRPDIVQSLEMQHGAYLTQKAWEYFNGERPQWIYNCWGNDIYYYQHDAKHRERIQAILPQVDNLITDCKRDHELAYQHGFKGGFLGVYPGGGGYHIDVLRKAMSGSSPSKRKTIVVKGYYGELYRPFTVLDALKRCQELLHDYTIVIYLPSPEVVEYARSLFEGTNIHFSVFERTLHANVIRLFGLARVSLACHISDGTPNTMLEAMIMGAFPVQSNTGATAEWIQHGQNGFLPDPEDVDGYTLALQEALLNDTLVDSAAEYNYALMKQKVDYEPIQKKLIAMYEELYSCCVR
jgi:glycosyltransferase involved in cell wall biosynthesis